MQNAQWASKDSQNRQFITYFRIRFLIKYHDIKWITVTESQTIDKEKWNPVK